MKYPTYPNYKRSGVEWIGEIPTHWEAYPVRRIAQKIQTGTTPPTSEERFYEDGIVPWFGPGSFDERITLSDPVKFLNQSAFDEGTARLFKSGATMVVTIGATVGKVSSLSAKGSCNQQITVIEFDERRVFPRFGTYQLKRLEPTLRGVAPSATLPILAQSDIGDFFVNLPPLAEQRTIADFLDGETARLDMLLKKKRELIEKLKEKRTAIISRTVTRGLPPEAARAAGINPNPKLKPSGVEWLGEIPENWEIVGIGRKITLQRGVDITKDEQKEGSVPVVSSGGIASFHDTALASGPGVVVGRKGTAGAVYYIESDFWPHDTTLWVREFRSNFPKYVYYKFCSMDLESFDTGSSNPTVNRNLVHPVKVSWPPKREQRAVAYFLDNETAKIDRMVKKVEVAIERLQEYRTALITAAVTGKIDVRGYARRAEAE